MDFEIFSSLDIKFTPSMNKKFLNYINLFKKYNSHTNLVSKNDENQLIEKHIFDSLAFNLYYKKYPKVGNIMDIGTGGGFPSLPLAIYYPKIDITAVDSTSKKINFLKVVKSELQIENIFPITSRIEELPTNYKNTFDVVTTRALSNLRIILEYAIPYIKTNGHFIAYKSSYSEMELKEAKNALKTLNTKLIDIIEYKLPTKENYDRKLLIFQKTKEVPTIYPRTYNIIKKAPL